MTDLRLTLSLICLSLALRLAPRNDEGVEIVSGVRRIKRELEARA